MLAVFSACNDEWTEEQYKHMVSFKAPVNNEGVADVYLRYKPDGIVTYQLPVMVSGSTLIDAPMQLNISVDSDSLQVMNETRFQMRTDLYKKLLGEEHYKLLSPTCDIPAGSNKVLYPVEFHFAGLDLSEEWVLPLSIDKSPNYEINTRKGWQKAFLHLLPFNDYSGNYSATSLQIYIGDRNNNPTVVSNITGRVVDENTIFFYSGIKQDRAIDRAEYKINVEFHETTLGEDNIERGNVTITAQNPAMQLEVKGQPTYAIREEMDATMKYLKRRWITINMEYTFVDTTTAENGKPIDYRVAGSVTMERKIDTTMPDEDQAILW